MIEPLPFAFAEEENNNHNVEWVGPWKDDTERWMCHQDFAPSMFLSMQLKDITCALARGSKATIEELKALHDIDNANACLELIKESQGVDLGLPVLPRGVFPHVDTIVDETFQSAQEEMALLEQRYYQKSMENKEISKKRKPDTLAIASKLNKACTDYLTEWMIDNAANPYPTQEDIAMLSLGCGLDPTQVNNWATNIRKRNQKATVEGGKKPHGFLDFQFLAVDRDRRKANKRSLPQTQPTTAEVDVDTQLPPNKRRKPCMSVETDLSVSIEMNSPVEVTAWSLCEEREDEGGDILEYFANEWLPTPTAICERRKDDEDCDLLAYFANEWHPSPRGTNIDSKSPNEGHFF